LNPLDVTVVAEMGYEVVDIPIGSTAWASDLTTRGTLSGFGIDRRNAARDAAEQAIRDNIRQMLDALYRKPATFQMVETPPVPVPQPIPMIPPVNMSSSAPATSPIFPENSVWSCPN
jgi:hypothetical protein